MIKLALCSAVLLVAVAAGAADKGKSASATFKDANGKSVGTATFTEKEGGVEISIKVSGLPAGKHGIHLHEKGVCEPPGFKSAGDHFNPFHKRHGAANPQGKHAGDLPNLVVKKNGTAETTVTAEGTSLGKGAGSLLKAGGTSIVIHAGPDDEKSDPAGKSGDRIACGVVTAQ